MISLGCSFLLSDLQQIPWQTVEHYHFFLEGIIVDANDLRHEKTWEKIETNLEYLQNNHPLTPIRALHFPTDNANYIENKLLSKLLDRFLKLAGRFAIPVVVLHANFITQYTDFRVEDLATIRDKFQNYFATLNKLACTLPVTVGIENLPIIGNEGTDFDSVFVLPSDFAKLNFSNIRITWDLGHWAYTYSSLQHLAQYSPSVQVKTPAFLDFLALEERIVHYHFSSYSGYTYPGSASICVEGTPPSDGDGDESLLVHALTALLQSDKQHTITLEIAEVNYHQRDNLTKTLTWFFRNKLINRADKNRLTNTTPPRL